MTVSMIAWNLLNLPSKVRLCRRALLCRFSLFQWVMSCLCGIFGFYLCGLCLFLFTFTSQFLFINQWTLYQSAISKWELFCYYMIYVMSELLYPRHVCTHLIFIYWKYAQEAIRKFIIYHTSCS